MKQFVLAPFVFLFLAGHAQSSLTAQNIFIITTDGFRWQEVFNGADSALINDTGLVRDTALLKELYWDGSAEIRRKKLMPFFWNVIASKGQLYGNRKFENTVDVKNFFKISYPGYNEILTGFADPHFIPNTPVNNPNINILEYLDAQQEYHGKVVAFASWKIFPYILNTQRNKIHLDSGYGDFSDWVDGADSDEVRKVQKNISDKSSTRYDWLTFITAKDYIQQHHPKIVFISLGETDEFAHQSRYDLYLQQASAIDKMISDLWYYVQTDPFYKNNTSFIITTDHGRGRNRAWHTHGLFTRGSGEAWIGLLGAGISAGGEIKERQRIYQRQLAATVAGLIGQKFETSHIVAAPIQLPYQLQPNEFFAAKTLPGSVK